MIGFDGSAIISNNFQRWLSRHQQYVPITGNKRSLDCGEAIPMAKRSKPSRSRSAVNFISITLSVPQQDLPDILIDDHRVQTSWDVTHVSYDILQASVTVYVDGIPLLENTIVCSTEDSSESNDPSVKMFADIAHLCQKGELAVSHTRFCCSASKVEAIVILEVSNMRFSQRFCELLNAIYPPPPCPSNTRLEDFFTHLQPPVSAQYLSDYVADALSPTLAPFQTQNVQWMLEREHHEVASNGRCVRCLATNSTADIPFLWEKITLETDKIIYVNRTARRLSTTWTDELQHASHKLSRGGILADEMGLGKTVSCLGLILLHRMNTTDPCHPKKEHIAGLTLSGATLIITPAAITQQWQSEIKKHAPSLRLFVYGGIRSQPMLSVEEFSQYDIVLTNYEVLRNEVYHARDPPDRPRRHAIKYELARSPLVQILWWRCILDEAQMVESPVAHTAEMARLIPRWYSWGVTGTPMKSNYKDLFGLYLFLDVIPDIPNLSLFGRLYKSPELMGLFWDLTRRTMRRNMKALLKNQVHIPAQRRNIVNVSFSNIEEQYYNNLWERCLDDGAISTLESIDWIEPEDRRSPMYAESRACFNRLQQWLLWLRQACVHPSVGTQARRLASAAAKSLNEVLDIMIQQARDKIDETETSIIGAMLRRAGMYEVLREWAKSLDVYLSAIPRLVDLLSDIAKQIDQHKEGAKKLSDDTSDETNADNSTERTLQALLLKQHSWQSLLHRFYFFAAGIYHELEQRESETKYYDLAAGIRRHMLTRAEERVNNFIMEMKKTKLCVLDGAKMETTRQTPTKLLTDEMIGQINGLSDKINRQLSCIKDWRKELLNMLYSNLVDYGDDEAKGDEYENSLVTQEKGNIYQDAYQDIIHDRNFLVNGIWGSTKKQNHNEEAEASTEGPSEDQSEDHSEETKQLEIDLATARKEMAPKSEASIHLRLLVAQLREIGSRPHISESEKVIVASEIDRLSKEITKQKKLQEDLESEYRKFSQLYNHRIEYYRALQAISDHVVPWESSDPKRDIDHQEKLELKFSKKLTEHSAKYRYLVNLSKEESNIEEMSCLICHSEFSDGIMTNCGHMYCDQCATSWFGLHRKCPQCSAPVEPSEWHKVARDAIKKANQPADLGSAGSSTQGESAFESLMNQVKRCDIHESLGAKMDGIIRHIKYIKESSKGKCVVFSQWKKVLQMLGDGLRLNDINYVDFGKDTLEAFNDDPNTHVILLHARSQSSGLTLVSAHTVFIVEPVLNESIEKQAISRVHRIGQTKETDVFWYIVKGSIEERIQAIHDAKRRQRMTHDTEDMESVQQPPVLEKIAGGGGEVVSHDDLRRCFTSDEDWDKDLAPS